MRFSHLPARIVRILFSDVFVTVVRCVNVMFTLTYLVMLFPLYLPIYCFLSSFCKSCLNHCSVND